MSTREDQFRQVLKFTLSDGLTVNVMEALGWDVNRFDEGFALANDMQNLDLVKLLYSNFTKNLIVVELTLVGISKAQRLTNELS